VRFNYRLHALERMFDRMIDPEEVEKAVLEGEIIEEYPEDKPYPSALNLYQSGKGPLHVVYAKADDGFVIITVYRPDQERWEKGFRRRRKK